MTRRCGNCETLNDTFVNPNTCWECGEPWPERPRIPRASYLRAKDGTPAGDFGGGA